MTTLPIIDRTFWNNFFGSPDNFSLKGGKKYFLNRDRKKVITDNNVDDFYQNYGCEIEIKSANYVILDIDNKSKKSQRNTIKDSKIVDILLKEKQIYLEETVNGGIHAIFKFDCGVSILNPVVAIAEESFVFEFLKKCITHPSTNYNLLYAPIDPPEPIEFERFLNLTTDLLIKAEASQENKLDREIVFNTIKSCFIQASYLLFFLLNQLSLILF